MNNVVTCAYKRCGIRRSPNDMFFDQKRQKHFCPHSV